MNFYKVDPVTDMGLKGKGPVIRQVRVKAMLDPAAYRRIKRNLFRVHNQFVSANDRRAAYDYFMLLCGPLSAENQARSRDGVIRRIHLPWRGSGASTATGPADGLSMRRTDKVLVAAGAKEVPTALIAQLKPGGVS